MPTGPELPIACSLTPGQMTERGEEFRALAERALVERSRDADGLFVRFRSDPGVEAAVRDLVGRERECCPFLDFDVAADDDDIRLRVTGPAEAGPILDSMFGATSPSAG